MFPVLWSILNIVLLLGFIYAWAKAVQLLWRSGRSGLAALFVLGTIGVVGARQPTGSTATKPAATPVVQVRQVVEQAGGLTWTLLASYHRDATGLRQLSGTTSMAGLVSGLSWQPGPVLLFEDGNQVRYSAAGNLEYKLLGATVYRETGQVFNGIVEKI